MAVNFIVNVRSLLSKVADIKYLSQFTPLVVGITESWLKPHFDPSFSKYSVVHRDRCTGSGGSLLYLLHSFLPYKESHQSYNRGALETLALQIYSHIG